MKLRQPKIMFDVVSVESILHFVRFQCVMSENIVVAFYLDCVHLEQLSWWLSPLNLYLSIFFFNLFNRCIYVHH